MGGLVAFGFFQLGYLALEGAQVVQLFPSGGLTFVERNNIRLNLSLILIGQQHDGLDLLFARGDALFDLAGLFVSHDPDLAINVRTREAFEKLGAFVRLSRQELGELPLRQHHAAHKPLVVEAEQVLDLTIHVLHLVGDDLTSD